MVIITAYSVPIGTSSQNCQYCLLDPSICFAFLCEKGGFCLWSQRSQMLLSVQGESVGTTGTNPEHVGQ